MKINLGLVNKMKELPPHQLNGMLFKIRNSIYILAIVDVEQRADGVFIQSYSLLNLCGLNRWTHIMRIDELCEELKREKADYLGRTAHLEDIILAYPKDLSIIEELNKPKVQIK